MDIPAIGAGVIAVAICSLIAWIAFLLTCIVIVKISKDDTEGLKDFAAAVKAYRHKFALGTKKAKRGVSCPKCSLCEFPPSESDLYPRPQDRNEKRSLS